METTEKQDVVVYSSNNSGGGWWLGDKDWKALEEAGWVVHWVSDPQWGYANYFGESGRWLGALAIKAHRAGLSYDEAVAEWEQVTGEYAEDEGCSCCGGPHYFYESTVDYE